MSEPLSTVPRPKPLRQRLPLGKLALGFLGLQLLVLIAARILPEASLMRENFALYFALLYSPAMIAFVLAATKLPVSRKAMRAQPLDRDGKAAQLAFGVFGIAAAVAFAVVIIGILIAILVFALFVVVFHGAVG